MEPKKISFGFSKIVKKSNIFNKTLPERKNEKELITCLEENSIKPLHEKDDTEKPLIIPLKDRKISSSALASLRLRQAVLNGTTNETSTENNSSKPSDDSIPCSTVNDSIEKRAVQELLDSAYNRNAEEENNTELKVVPKPDELPLDGASEPTLDDYESIPISKFGFAMLRGMGWKGEENPKSSLDIDGPMLRPKGMGLGADKLIKKSAPLVPPEPNEKLIIKKEACVKILAGKHKDLYGQIEGFDDHAGRIIVRMALGGSLECMNEFLVQPVSKNEYAKYGKVINSAKYEQYAKKENEQEKVTIKKETNERDFKVKTERDEGNERLDSLQSRRENETRNYRRERDEISSSSDSEDSYYRRREKHKSSKSKKKKSKSDHHRHSSNYSFDSDESKRHKKKTKKSKRPRSRSKGRR